MKLGAGKHLLIASLSMVPVIGFAQVDDKIIDDIVTGATENSLLPSLAHELLDGIGPRLVGSPQMEKAHEWAVAKYGEWGIDARNEQWGEWRGWERGITHIDMVSPWVRSLEGRQLAWSPGTNGETIIADVVLLPDLSDSAAFKEWLPNVQGKFVLVSMPQPTGRPDYNWEEFATPESFEKMRKEREAQTEKWTKRISQTGYNMRTLPEALENAGAAGIIASYWSNGFGVNKVFSAFTKKVPTIDLALEDYGLLYRLVESGKAPKISLKADAKELGTVPTFNTIAEIKGVENPDEYVVLSAHFDSWDGGTGATDNGTGTLVMMEAMRLLKKFYPNPKRTILVGHWGSEEQGLNGSRGFVEDHPEIVDNVQALFNQDNGTGRVVNISGQGFLHAYDYLTRWLDKVPEEIKKHIETSFPGSPSTGGSDNASFVAAGAPAFSLSSLNWSYWNYTWHTNRDTYDKIVFDDLRNNVILTAILAYMASEDPERASKEKAVLPRDERSGEQMQWPERKSPTRKGMLD
ncbi:M20/M25/M40 family metallo-hydrolase [Olivibacter sp. SDN3]|uniref:M20/M25/M40 family metallo-hydrolase n=1 Tax=Olivibacter sp. SDN3 TaxID=2764720 RepID=UPI0016515393|nr:M20/M25/M40 family metallo-hydrolase [Olivibacter sp. SDN3]QNL50496.1 M20/M25/M40 family metallo-hydrolase [Olivibacter sp. SDN3]